MTTILKDNKGIYIVHFNNIECDNIQYNSLELAQSLCRIRLGSNIWFFRIPFKTKWVVVNNLKLFI
jgi:hypothetical protein